jgi:two-component system cell cycle response regulator
MTYRVLIVDDDEDARILLIRALSKSPLPLDLLTASDGRKALDIIARNQPHAVITDVMMPRVDGFELCAALRADRATAHIPVIMVTALEDAGDRERGLASGADDYLTKPFNAGELTARLSALLAARYPH